MSNKKEQKTGTKHEAKNYTVEVKYSPDAIREKKVRFTAKEDGSFEISTDELIDIVAMNVNSQVLAPMFVETDKVNIVQVERTLNGVLDEDKKKGDTISMNYFHPYPVEFAILEEVYKIAKIKDNSEVVTLTKEFIEETKKKLQPEMDEFVQKFYKSYNKLELKK